ncbi:MAG: hypothetical protein WDZ37_07235 [Solirubrobacterales bacterium]
MAQAEIIQTFTISTPPAKAGKPIAFNVTETTSDSAGPGVQPPPLRQQIIRINKGGQYNGQFFPRCDKQELLDKTTCPAGSKIGTGNGTGVALPIVPSVSATLTLWNGEKQSGHNTVYVYAVPDLGPNFVTIGEVYKQPKGAFDYKLDFKIDPIQTLPGAPDASVTSVNTKTPIKKAPAKLSRASTSKKKKKPAKYLTVAPKKCTGKWVGESEFHYQVTGGPEIVKTVQGQVTCKK